MPTPMKQAPVFVISTGRSGSTLLQRVLNCHPDLVIWGEYHGFIGGFAEPFHLMGLGGDDQFPVADSRNDEPKLLVPAFADPDAGLNWCNPSSRDEYNDQARQMITSYFASRLAPGQRWGFKEVRYNEPLVLAMLLELFPLGRFVFLRRNPLEVVRSKVLAWNGPELKQLTLDQRLKHIGKMLEEVRRHFELYDAFSAKNPQACCQVRYEDLVESPADTIRQMLAQLQLQESSFNWGLSEQVLEQVVSSTKVEAFDLESEQALATHQG